MILCAGEILIDRLVSGAESARHVGGAPFNVAVAAARAGAKVRFVGKVGDDENGRFVLEEAAKYGVELAVAKDARYATTVALVTLTEGERSFRFLREGAADYRLNVDDLDWSDVDTLHLGTLMLNQQEGCDFFASAVAEARKRGVRITVDANFRDDLFADTTTRNQIMLPYLRMCDVLKLGEDELYSLTDAIDPIEGAKRLGFAGLLLVTMGKKGSMAYQNGATTTCPAHPIDKIVDTTGAGDAFFGTALAYLERDPVPSIDAILTEANRQGALATQRVGAV